MDYSSNIIYIHFIDIKGTAWGHSQVIGMCFHSIFYISCIELDSGLPVALLYIVGCYAKCTLCLEQ